MKITDLKAIDAHAHYGAYWRDDGNPLTLAFMSASAEKVVERGNACGVEWSLVSPFSGLFPRNRADAVGGNIAAFGEVPLVRGLLQMVIVNPLQPKTYEQAREMLKAPWCVGIKIHPEEHGYKIADHGEELFSFFEEVQAPVMTHSGCPNSLPAAFVPFANNHPGARILLAHLGNGAGDRDMPDLQVRAVQAARHGNLSIDTSSGRSLLPGIIEFAVREVGAEKLLFGSDTPIYHVAVYRMRIEAAEISDDAKRLILRENALKFFNLSSDLDPQKGWT